jgi:predicted phage baseplate assembly protein
VSRPAASSTSSGCGCCAGAHPRTPITVENRPGLAAVAYRAGTHARFKQSMLARLSASSLGALRALSTRDDDDFTIALLDAWAVVADVLTFYQERLANEHYLRTARERRSLPELARLIGYQLRPGVAASTHLAFTLDESPGSPGAILLEAGVQVQSVPGPGERPQTFETLETIEARVEWNAMRPRLRQPQTVSTTAAVVFVAGVASGLAAGDALLIVTGTATALRRVQDVLLDEAGTHTAVALAPSRLASATHAASAAPEPAARGVFAMRTRAALFGHSAPSWDAMPDNVRVRFAGTNHGSVDDWPANWPAPDHADPDGAVQPLDLDTRYPGVAIGSWVVVARPGVHVITRVATVQETAASDFTISAKLTRVGLADEVPAPDQGEVMAAIRSTTVHAVSERLDLAETPITSAVGGDAIELDRSRADLEPGQAIAITGERADEPGVTGCEVGVLAEVTHAEGRTTLALASSLAQAYLRESVTVNANLAFASHGERVREVLGSGDAGAAYQRFVLRQAPLTYVTAPTPSGSASTLEVRVQDQRWHEVPTLFGRGPSERVFVTSTGVDGRTVVQFGDGSTGARLPSGPGNVKASYRKGLGLEGEVARESLDLLLTRPLGLRAVVNPAAATGASDPETVLHARANAPTTVRTLDRVVSLRDYEDFARGFAGIDKALATWTGAAPRRGVFVTVAGPGGAEVASGGALHANLVSAMRDSGPPFARLEVATYRPATFALTARVELDPDQRSETVLAAVDTALRERFSFAARAFGQAVTLGEVFGVVHDVPGVVAVVVDRLERTAAGATPGLAAPGLGGAGLGVPAAAGLGFAAKLPASSALAAMLPPAFAFAKKLAAAKQLAAQPPRVEHRLRAALPERGPDGAMAAAELLTLDPGALELRVTP